MPSLIDLTGRKYGRLTVVKQIPARKNGLVRWECVCVCGRSSEAYGSTLRAGLTRSCGCLEAESRGKSQITHGLSGTPEHRIWKGMKNRCNCTRSSTYVKYGAKGIKVCERWEASFTDFLSDMGPRPSPRHSIDRINPSLGYGPENCRWATPQEQARNKVKKPGVFGIAGIYWNKSGLAFQAYIGRGISAKYIGTFKDFFEACCARKSAEHLHWS